MKSVTSVTCALGVLCIGGLSHAGDFDGSKALTCATIEAIECAPGGKCLRGWAREINLPQFVTVDLAAKSITGKRPNDGSQLAAKIKSVSTKNSSLMLQGVQNDRAWSMVIAKDNGFMSVSVSAEDAGFVVFGACTPK